MQNKTVVLFEKGKIPRIFKNPESLSKLQERGPILVNPSLPKGVPPHLWKLVNGKISIGAVKQTVFKLEEIKKTDSSKWLQVTILGILITLLSIHIYEDREIIRKIPSQIRSFF